MDEVSYAYCYNDYKEGKESRRAFTTRKEAEEWLLDNGGGSLAERLQKKDINDLNCYAVDIVPNRDGKLPEMPRIFIVERR